MLLVYPINYIPPLWFSSSIVQRYQWQWVYKIVLIKYNSDSTHLLKKGVTLQLKKLETFSLKDTFLFESLVLDETSKYLKFVVILFPLGKGYDPSFE